MVFLLEREMSGTPMRDILASVLANNSPAGIAVILVARLYQLLDVVFVLPLEVVLLPLQKGLSLLVA
jgi:hypothetical protein